MCVSIHDKNNGSKKYIDVRINCTENKTSLLYKGLKENKYNESLPLCAAATDRQAGVIHTNTREFTGISVFIQLHAL